MITAKKCDSCASTKKPLYGNLGGRDLRVCLDKYIISFTTPFFCRGTLSDESNNEMWYRVTLCSKCVLRVLESVMEKLIKNQEVI